MNRSNIALDVLLSAESNGTAVNITLDLAAVLTTLLWAGVIIFVFVRFRDPLAEFLRELPRRVRSVSAVGVSIELAEPEPRPLLGLQGVAVDLRQAGTPTDVNDSTLRSFYAQIEDPTRLEYAVVDLGFGSEWLSSRLYILSVILRRMRGLQAFVFVTTVENDRRRFLGICDAEELRWRLAARWPRFESALAAAELRVWGHPYDDATALPVPGKLDPNAQPMSIPAFRNWAAVQNTEGRMMLESWPSPEPAAELLRSFLDAVQRPAPPSDEWQPLPSTPGTFEYAVWLNGSMVSDVLRESLDLRSIRLNDWQGWSNELRTRAVLESERRWVAVTRDQGVFDRLIDRTEVLEQVAKQAIAAD